MASLEVFKSTQDASHLEPKQHISMLLLKVLEGP